MYIHLVEAKHSRTEEVEAGKTTTTQNGPEKHYVFKMLLLNVCETE